jgi:hypothetical protein
MKDEQIAQIAHEVIKAYCEALGDFSQPKWKDAPDWQRESAISGIKFHKSNPGATPEQMHESWLKMKRDDGWKYGLLKNAETKEHPCFRPFSHLPVEQKAKDYIFLAVVNSCLNLS